MRNIIMWSLAAVLWSLMAWMNVAQAETLSGAAQFTDFNTHGNGCPDGSASYLPTATAFTVLFDSYVATAGQGAPQGDAVKSCFVNAKVTVPAGWQFAIDTVDYRGFVSVQKGAGALMGSWFLMSGKGTADFGASRESVFKGPSQVDYTRRDQHIGLEAKRWTACGGGKYDVTLFSYIFLASVNKAQAYMSVDSADGAGSLKTAVTWRKCK